MNSTSIIPFLETLNKDLAYYENEIAVIWIKFGREHSAYKQFLFKTNELKEKNLQAVANLKEHFVITSDDPHNFKNFESKLYDLRQEESIHNDNLMEISKRYKVYLEEFLVSIKKTIKAYKDEENLKIGEIKDKIFMNLFNYNEKSLKHISDFISCFETIANNSQINDEINDIFIKNFKSFKVPESYYKSLMEKKNKDISQNNNIIKKANTEEENFSPNTLNLLNEEDIIKPKTFNYDFLKKVSIISLI